MRFHLKLVFGNATAIDVCLVIVRRLRIEKMRTDLIEFK